MTVIFVDYDEIDDRAVRRIESCYGREVHLVIKDEAIITAKIPFGYMRVPGSRNYSVYRKEIDELIQGTLGNSKVKIRSQTLCLGDILKFDLLFSLDHQLYSFWVVQHLTTKFSNEKLVFVFRCFTVEEYFRLRKVRQALLRNDICVLIERGSSVLSLVKMWAKRKLFFCKKNLGKLLRTFRGTKQINVYAFDLVVLEHYASSLRLSMKCISRLEDARPLYVIDSDLSKELVDGQPWVAIDAHKTATRFNAFILFLSLRQMYKKMIYRHFANSDIFPLFNYQAIFEIFWKEFVGASFEAINLVLAYNRLLHSEEFTGAVLTTNFTNLFSRVFCAQYQLATSIYLQHGVIPLHSYLFAFPHSHALLWGERYAELIKKSNVRCECLVTGDLGNILSGREIQSAKSDRVTFLYFASRPGGSNVSRSLHFYILDLISAIASENPAMLFRVKLHPTDRLNYSKFIAHNLIFHRKGDAKELMSNADIIGFTSSSTGLESLCSNAELVWVNPLYPLFSDLLDYSAYNVPLVRSISDLQKAMNDYISKIIAIASDERETMKREYYSDISFDLRLFKALVYENAPR